ncbi:hypothetical protein BHE74_00040417 [Ensete ventricosum]|nr:hypothetical protein BHE74_00040417 [Ensete ventricosum]
MELQGFSSSLEMPSSSSSSRQEKLDKSQQTHQKSLCLEEPFVATGMGLWLERHVHQLDALSYYRRKYFTNDRFNGELEGQRQNLTSEISVDPNLLALLRRSIEGEERVAAHDFFLTLAACNTVIPMVKRNPCPNSSNKVVEAGEINYQGESPDEQALVVAASSYGYTLLERTTGHVVVNVNGKKIRRIIFRYYNDIPVAELFHLNARLDVLGLHEFDSVRKRMSVVIRFPNNAVKVLVKGADSSMLSILDEKNEKTAKIKQMTEHHLCDYSSQGLRTLVIAARDLNDAEFEEWQERYEEASTSLIERSMKLRQAATLVENNLDLLGATAIEDKLQDGVPEAIESLRQAGIKVWVLTGDKQETAISIGLSCRLLTPNMHQIIINGTSEHECRRLLANAKAKYGIKSAEHRDGTLKLKKFDYDFVDNADDKRTSSVSIPETGKQNLRYTGGVDHDSNHCGDKVAGSDDISLALIIDGNSLVYILEKDLEPEVLLLIY